MKKSTSNQKVIPFNQTPIFKTNFYYRLNPKEKQTKKRPWESLCIFFQRKDSYQSSSYSDNQT